MRYTGIHAFAVHMSPAFNGSFALQQFECSKAVELRNGIMFDFHIVPDQRNARAPLNNRNIMIY